MDAELRAGPSLGAAVGSSGSYLTPPVVLWDGYVVGARPAGRDQAVELGGEVGEVAVEVQVLGVLPSTCPPVVASALKTQATPSQGSGRTPALIVPEAGSRAGLRVGGTGGGLCLASCDELGSTSALGRLCHLSGPSHPASLLTLHLQGRPGAAARTWSSPQPLRCSSPPCRSESSRPPASALALS